MGRTKALALCIPSLLIFQPFQASAFRATQRAISNRPPSVSRLLLPQSVVQPAVRNGAPLLARSWEGDDTRWLQRLRRKFAFKAQTPTPARSLLLLLNVVFFCYQVVNSVNFIRHSHPSFWPSQAPEIVADALLGGSIDGPLTMNLVHSIRLSKRQPHRYLTSGFLHGGLIHLLVNMDSLLRSPSWLETGLGWPLFLSAFIVGIIGGNIWHTLSALDNSICLGASGGICGLYGLMFTALTRMGNPQGGARVLRGMGLLLLYGVLFENISNAAHIGGFLGGIIIGILCGPGYRKSYTMRRKNSLDVDFAPADYRQVMGFGKVSTGQGLIPVYVLWTLALLALASQPLYRDIPMLIYRGIVHPGSLSKI